MCSSSVKIIACVLWAAIMERLRQESNLWVSKTWSVLDSDCDMAYWEAKLRNGAIAKLSLREESNRLVGQVTYKKSMRGVKRFPDDRASAILMHPRAPKRYRMKGKQAESDVRGSEPRAESDVRVSEPSPSDDAFPSAPTPSPCLARYHFENLLGQGVSGSAWAATDQQTRKRVVVKVANINHLFERRGNTESMVWEIEQKCFRDMSWSFICQ